MSSDATPGENAQVEVELTTAVRMPSQKWPWITLLYILACVVIYLGLAVQNDYQTWDALSHFGVLPPTAIWGGAYWGLITPAFVHFALWHLAFNMYWLWVLGRRMERAVGSLRFLLFVVGAAFVGSSLQLAVSGSTGIGASGVVYAIFGFMWLTRDRYPQYQGCPHPKLVKFFLAWLVGCMVLTGANVLPVANTAHVSGLLFGIGAAGSFVTRHRARLSRVGLAALVVVAIVPLFWSPWSAEWLAFAAYNAHVAQRYDLALARYNRLLRMDPDNTWALENRGRLYETIGEAAKANADIERAHEIDPSIDEEY